MTKREWNLFKRELKDYRHWICSTLVLISLCFSIFYFKFSPYRIYEGLRDIVSSGKYYFSELFDLNLSGDISVKKFSELPLDIPFGLPQTWGEFKVKCKLYWDKLISKENLLAYLAFLVNILFWVSKILMLLMPIILTFYILKKFKKEEPNNNYNQDSNFLKAYKKIVERKIFRPVKNWFKNFIGFLKDNTIYLKLLGLIWLYNFNGFGIILEVIAFLIYFTASFTFIDIYVQVVKLLMDLTIVFSFVPIPIWVVAGMYAIDKFRKFIGYARLEKFESRIRDFLEELSLVSFICGTMGTGKTTMITDMALSQEIMFRDKALERMQKCWLKFPHFNWINLELSIKRAMVDHTIYSLATTRKFIRLRRKIFKKQNKNLYIFDYDYQLYGFEYDNGIYVENIWDVISTYAQLYLIYVTQSSLILSNYSIRSDIKLDDIGNFPVWVEDLFRSDSKKLHENSNYSHILDNDMLRLGKLVVERNKNANTFEFGVIVITEIGKDRGNVIENKKYKYDSATANPLNDLFNAWLKMLRHSATVDNFPFVKVICDDQRPESWGADARELCEIGVIEKRSEKKLAMPFFFFEDLFINWKLKRGNKAYTEHRYMHGDNTLKSHISQGINSKLFKYHNRIWNQFGYDKLTVNVEKGTQDGAVKEKKYYLIDSKIRRKRFSTDCFSEVFEEKALRSEIGLNDLQCFKTDKATFEEMLLTNSYFVNELARIKTGENQQVE